MLAFLPMGMTLERAMGSFQLAWLIAVLIFAGDGLYIGAAYAADVAGYSGLLSQCAVGFSGVIFGLIPLDVRISGGAQRSIFGLFAVPSVAYPWVLLVIWQLLVPQSSFLGHLSGLAIGQIYSMGYLKWITPSAEAVQHWERTAVLGRCVAVPSYIANTGSSGYTGGEGVTESLLPMHYAAGGAGAGSGSLFGSLGANAGAGMQRWLSGLRMQYPSVLNPNSQEPASSSSNSSGPGGSNSGNSTGLRKDIQQQQPAIGAVLGGVPTHLDPKTAAAKAAELRIAKSGQPQPQQAQQGKGPNSNSGQQN